MATKSALIASINGFITAIITQAKLRSGFLDVVNELYPSKVLDNSTDETYTTQTNANITYSIQILKQGRNIRIDGTYTYSGLVALEAGTEIFEFKESQFKGDTSPYLGVNIRYVPFALESTKVISPSSTTQFSLTISSNA
jgi:hypothetical protein